MDNPKNQKNINKMKKEYLRGYGKHKQRVARIEAELEEIRRMKSNPCINLDGMPHGNQRNDMSQFAATVCELEEKLHQESILQVQTYQEIKALIDTIKPEEERDVMFYRYIKNKEFWQIAAAMHFSERWAYELHGRALKKINIPKECSPLQS